MNIVADVRYALRSLGRSKTFTFTAVVTLAIGIGANTAIFSVVNAVLLRPLPVRQPEELVSILGHRPGEEAAGGFTNALWESIRDQQHVFPRVFAWSVPLTFELREGDQRDPIDVVAVSGAYFDTLGITATRGRLINTSDDRRGCQPTAVLSYAFWQSHFGGSERIVGSGLTIASPTFDVLGVSAAGFSGLEVGRKFDVAIPICAAALFDPRNIESRGRWWLSVGGRVAPDRTADQMQADLEVLSPRVMAAAEPDRFESAANRERYLHTRLEIAPAATGTSAFRRTFGEPLRILMAAVAVLLLIACANIAGVMVARATARSREVAIRGALGASAGQLIRHVLAESALLALLGAVLGYAVARSAAELLVHTLATSRNPLFVDVALDGRVLVFTTLISVVTALLLAIIPARRATHAPLVLALKGLRATRDGGSSRSPVGTWIVAAQIALSLVLLVAAGLLVRTLSNLTTLDPGFDRRNVVVVTAKPPRFARDLTDPSRREASLEAVSRRIRGVPGVISIARAYTTPIGDDNWYNTISTDMPSTPSGRGDAVYFNLITPGYFTTLRTPLLGGRDFDSRDTASSTHVAIVNETFARKFYAGVNPLGRRFTQSGNTTAWEIVAIVKDSKYETMREAIHPTAFVPASQAPAGGDASEFVIRTAISAPAMIPAIRASVGEVARELPLTFQTLDAQVADDLAQDRLLAVVAGCFGAVAVLLAAVGLYGLLSYFVTQQRLDFGIRIAIGASPASILRFVLRDVAVMLIVGLGAGLAIVLTSAPLLQRLLYELAPHDTATIAGAVIVLVVTALVAAYLPARRATRVDPLIALRAE